MTNFIKITWNSYSLLTAKLHGKKNVESEVKKIDFFLPSSASSSTRYDELGLLGRMPESSGIFEPFSNAVNLDEICDCLVKLREVCRQLQREAKRDRITIQPSDWPKLWILTPTASKSLLSIFGARIDKKWLAGVYVLVPGLRSAIVVLHQLLAIPETLWLLRILGKGKVQRQAIDELEALPKDDSNRSIALQLLLRTKIPDQVG